MRGRGTIDENQQSDAAIGSLSPYKDGQYGRHGHPWMSILTVTFLDSFSVHSLSLGWLRHGVAWIRRRMSIRGLISKMIESRVRFRIQSGVVSWKTWGLHGVMYYSHRSRSVLELGHVIDRGKYGECLGKGYSPGKTRDPVIIKVSLAVKRRLLKGGPGTGTL